MKIKFKIFLFFFIIFIVFGGGLVFQHTETINALIDEVGKNGITYARDITDRLDQRTHDSMINLRIIAVDPEVRSLVKKSNLEFEKIENTDKFLAVGEEKWHSYAGKDNPIFNEMIKNPLSQRLVKLRQTFHEASGVDIFPEIMVSNAFGAVIAENNRLTDWDVSDRLLFQNTKKYGWHISDLYYDRSANVWGLEVAVDIRNDDNFAGVVKTAYNIEDIIEILSESGEGAPYENVELHLFTGDGRTIYSAFSDYELGDELSDETLQLFVDGEGFFPYEIEGEKKWFAFSKSDGYRDFPGLSWIVAVSIPESEFLGEMQAKQDLLLAGLVASSILIIVISVFTVKSISSPIVRLRDSMAEVGKGNLDTRFDYDKKDEFGDISKSFNVMTKSLKELDAQTRKDKETIETQLKEIKGVDKQKDEFVAMISHELKTPMTPIKIFSSALMRPKMLGELNEKQKEAANAIHFNALRLERIVVDLLDAQKLELGKMKFEKKEMKVEELMAQITTNLKSQTEEKGGQLINHTTEKITIQSDNPRLAQVLTNLVNNAIDFIPEKDGKIEINAQKKDGEVQFSVKDNGSGMTLETQKKLFQKFYKADTSITRKHGGTGLGLAICKGIVEALGGKIWVESEEGKGANFYFTTQIDDLK